MPEYDVKIKATIIKTERVEADNEDEAIELAHQQFTTMNTGADEYYDQDTEECKQLLR